MPALSRRVTSGNHSGLVDCVFWRSLPYLGMFQQNCFDLFCANFKKLFGDMLLARVWLDVTARAFLNVRSNGC